TARWARRHRPVVVSVVVSAVVVVLLALVGLAASNVAIRLEQQETEKARQDTDAVNQKLQQNQALERRARYFYGMALADREWGRHNADRVEQILDDCPEEPRGWEWHYFKRLCHLNLLTLRHTGPVAGVAFSPNGERLAATGKSAKVWDA